MLLSRSQIRVAFHGKMQQFAVVGQIRKFCKSHDGREKFTAFVINNNIQHTDFTQCSATRHLIHLSKSMELLKCSKYCWVS